MNWAIEQKIQSGFAAAMGFLLLAGVSGSWSARRQTETDRMVVHTYEVMDRLHEMLAQILTTETSSRGFAISGREDFLEPYSTGITLLRQSFSMGKYLTSDNPDQQRRWETLEPLIEQKIAHTKQVIALRQSGDSAAALHLITSGSGKHLMDGIRQGIDALSAEEERLLHQRAARAQRLDSLTFGIGIFGSVLALGLVGWAGVTVRRDFSKRRQAEESLAVTLQSIGDAVLATDRSGRITRMNPIAEKLMGWTQAEAAGKRVEELFRIINEETRQPTVVPVGQVLATGLIHGLANHTILIARDGTECPIADSAAPIRDKNGFIIGVVLVFRDVSEERKGQLAILESERRLRVLNEELEQRVSERTAALAQSQQQLRQIIDLVPAFIFAKDREGRFLLANRMVAESLGRTPAEVEGKTQWELTPRAAEAQRYLEDDRKVIDSGQPKFIPTESFTSAQGVVHILQTSKIPFQAFGTGERAVLGVSMDITERQRQERLALRSQRLEAIGTLAGGVAHDLNNALAPILMGVEILKTQYPNACGIVDMFESSAKRSAAMVRQLLTFAKGAEGEQVAVQPVQLIKEMHRILKSTFPKNIQIEVHCAQDQPLLLGDPTQLHQVLLNLCVNARDAMPNGGKLTLESERVEVDSVYANSVPGASPGKYLAFRVCDTGTGIAPEILEQIFDPFFTTKGPDKGTGLGLSTVLGIVKGHGGFMQVYSLPGRGSTFTAYLPASLTATDPDPGAHPATEFHGQGEMILLVDDEAAVRKVARSVLGRLNFKALTASDGAQGLIQVTEFRAELRAIVTDVHMPQMDGLTFVRACRRLLPDIPIVAMSGRLEDQAVEEFKALGVFIHLDKPFTQAELAEVLRKVLG